MIRKGLRILGVLLLMTPLCLMGVNHLKSEWIVRSYLHEAETGMSLWEAVEYNAALKSGLNDEYPRDALLGVLEIPAISLQLPVYYGTSENTLDNGLGHLEGTALPVGQKGERPVIAGHRGLPSSELFMRLDELKKGDTFTITAYGQQLTYEVMDTETVLPDQADALKPKPDKDLMTLVTCTPYGINSHRLLVTGARTKTETGQP